MTPSWHASWNRWSLLSFSACGTHRCRWSTTKTASTSVFSGRRSVSSAPSLIDEIPRLNKDCRLRCRLGRLWSSSGGCWGWWDVVGCSAMRWGNCWADLQFLQSPRRSPTRLRRLTLEFHRCQLLWSNERRRTPTESRCNKRNSSAGTSRALLRIELWASLSANRAKLSTAWERLWCRDRRGRWLLLGESRTTPTTKWRWGCMGRTPTNDKATTSWLMDARWNNKTHLHLNQKVARVTLQIERHLEGWEIAFTSRECQVLLSVTD